MKSCVAATLVAIALSYSAHAQTAESPLFNPAAEANYDANLNVNDMAIAVDQGAGQKTVKIFQKKNGLYQVGAPDVSAWEIRNSPNALKWYKANSLYPYYDVAAFNNKAGKYKPVVEAYLLCLSQKYNLNMERLTGRNQWPTYYIKDQAEHDEEKAKLEELYQLLNTEFTTLPNTFLAYTENPAIWKLVAKDRVELLDCLTKVENPSVTRILDFYLTEIASAKKSAAAFTGGTDGLYNGNTYPWMLRAVSKKAREEYIATQKGWNTNAGAVAKINAALDDLKPVCAPKLSLLKMDNALFQYHDAAAEALMKSYLKNPATLKINKTGISDPEWIVVKNSLGIPLNRYKRGTMWVRNSADDHPYCKGLYFVIKQDYAGGGFGKSYISEYSEELTGCQ